MGMSSYVMDEESKEIDRRVGEYMQSGLSRRDAEARVFGDMDMEEQDRITEHEDNGQFGVGA